MEQDLRLSAVATVSPSPACGEGREGKRMIRKGVTRRKLLASAAGVGSFAIIGRARAATPYQPSDSLLDAARKEGKFILYTATFTEVEQEVINEFRKKFPFIRV